MGKRSASGWIISRKLRAVLDAIHSGRGPSGNGVNGVGLAYEPPVQNLESRVMLSTTPATVSVQWQGRTVQAYPGQYVAETQHVNLLQNLAGKKGFTNVQSLGGEGYYSFDSDLPIATLAKLAVQDTATFELLSPNTVHHLANTVPSDPQLVNQWGMINTSQVEPYDYNGDGVVTPYNEIQDPTPPSVIEFPSPPYPNENQVGTPGDDIDVTKAWDVTTGSKSVVVAVLDSGIDLTHPDLIGNIWTNPLDTAANNFNGDGFPNDIHGWNFVAGDSDPTDDNGHGTNVSGIIGAVGNNGLGATGVDWNVSLLPVKVADAEGAISDANEISGINYCITLKDLGINIVAMNESLGGTAFPLDLAERNAIAQAGKAGILDVVAAGNDGTDLDQEQTQPAKLSLSLPNVITVAAVDNQFKLAYFSNYGASSVDLAAPGVDILNTSPTYPVTLNAEVALEPDIPQFTENYGYLSGTSQATPSVTGIIALEAAANPLASPAQLKSALLQGVTYDPALAASNGLPAKVATSGVANAYNSVQNILNDFVGTNTTRQGNWKNFYGSNGAFVVGESTSFPSFVTVDQTGGSPVIVNNDSKDLAALQSIADPTLRTSAYEAAAGSETINLNFTDGLVHQTTLYLADLDHQKRVESIQLVDNVTGDVLDGQTISNFTKGQYLTYDLRGNVSLRIINNSGPSAVYSGLFFDTPPTAPTTFISTDTTTTGANWSNEYGSEGAVLAGNIQQLPSYASFFSVVGATTTVLKAKTNKPVALQKLTDANSNVEAYYTAPTSLDLNLSTDDGLTHTATLYLADYDKQKRQERIQVIDSPTGNILAQEDIANFSAGIFVSFRITGAVTFRIINTAGPSAVVSGLFLDAPFGEKAHYLGTDTTTRGNWRVSQFGQDTAYIAGENLPDTENTNILVTDGLLNVLTNRTNNPTALQSTTYSAANNRTESYLYTPSSMVIAYNPGDFLIHTVALYFADYQNLHRQETLRLYDPATLKLLTTQTISNFSKGKYLEFDISGQVLFTITNGAYPNAVLSGVFTN